MHDAGIPVPRGGGGRRRAPTPLQLLDALYAGPEISAVLRRFHVPRRPRPGSIADRFPVPARLTVGLLRALYLDVGLSARQIELLTGEPFEQVLAHTTPPRFRSGGRSVGHRGPSGSAPEQVP